LWYFTTRLPPIPGRPLRIGFEPNPPVQIRSESGFSGLSVETIGEAAKRAGVRLQWVETGASSEESFQKGLVDLWPLMADLPERRKRLHMTPPWLRTNHVLLFRAGSVPPDRKFTGGIAVFKMPLHVRLVGERFPEAQVVQFDETKDILKSVCRGAVSAAFLEARVAATALREKPAECASVALRVPGLPDMIFQGAVGSTFQAAGAAEAIRREISGMFRDGTLAVLMAKYSYYGLENDWATYDLMQAAEHARWIAWGIGGLAIVLALAVWRVSSLRQRKQAEAARREIEERFRAIFQQAAVGVAQVNLDGEVAMVNDRYCEVLGYTRDELLGTTLMDRTHQDDVEGVLANRRRLLEGESSAYSMEMRCVRKDEAIMWLKLYGSLVRDEEARPRYFIAVVEDITERKRGEAALRESEERFRNMADTAPVMIWISDLDKRCTFFNSRWLDFTGRSIEQELGNGWLNGMHPEDLDRYRAFYDSSFEARRRFQMEYRLRGADGGYRWLLNNGTPLYRGGDFAGFIGSCIDITDQKLIEEQLRASEARLMEAQRLAKVGNWERRLDADSIYWSDEISRIFGATNPPSNFPEFLKCVHPKDREKILEADRTVRSTTAPVETEYRIIRPDGEVRHVRSIVEAIRNDQGAPVRLTGATQDVSEQVKARELLRESEQHLKNAERLAQVGHWHWDLRANRVSGSEEMFRIFGKPDNYIPSYEGFLEDLMPQDRERMERLIQDSLARKIGHSIEYQITHPNAGLRTISCIWEVLLDEDGSPVRVFGTCQDITDSRRAQEEALARQKLESLGVLAGGIAHDFNNLLGGILAEAELAEAELVEADLPAGSSVGEEIERIKAVAIRGAEIVRELMIYAGHDQTHLVEPLDLSELVEDMLELLKVSISKQAVLNADLDKNLPAVWGNAPQIRQVVMNLLINASEAIGEKEGVINVNTGHVSGRKDVDPTSVTDLPEGDYVRLEVSDTGCGMTEEAKAKIFDPFFTTKFAGRGLGLAVVQGIVRAHGGAIHLVSTPGQGTTFQVLLSCTPKRGFETQSVITSVSAEQSNDRAGTVLVVEDEELIRLAVAKALRRQGFSVMKASDGSAAMELIRTYKDDIGVILLDVTLPGKSSREVFEEVQRLRPDLKMILTSAYGKETVDATFAGLRVEYFIRKPFQLGDLVRLLGGTLSA
jgi:PAS domain S-box-containing protein